LPLHGLYRTQTSLRFDDFSVVSWLQIVRGIKCLVCLFSIFNYVMELCCHGDKGFLYGTVNVFDPHSECSFVWHAIGLI